MSAAPRVGTVGNPTRYYTNLTVPVCFYCDAKLVLLKSLYHCDACDCWFRVSFEHWTPEAQGTVVPLTVML